MSNWTGFILIALILTGIIVVLARMTATKLRGSVATETPRQPPEKPQREQADPVALPDNRIHPIEEADDTATPAAESTHTANRPAMTELSTIAIVGNIVLTHGAILAVLIGAVWWTQIPLEPLGVGNLSLGRAIVGGVITGGGLYGGAEVVVRALKHAGITYDDRLEQLLVPDHWYGWGLVIGIAFPIIAVAEEMLFRAALIGGLAAGTGITEWLFIIPATVAFAVGHALQGAGGIVVTGLLGLALGILFVSTNSLLLVVVAHTVVNTLELIAAGGD